MNIEFPNHESQQSAPALREMLQTCLPNTLHAISHAPLTNRIDRKFSSDCAVFFGWWPTRPLPVIRTFPATIRIPRALATTKSEGHAFILPKWDRRSVTEQRGLTPTIIELNRSSPVLAYIRPSNLYLDHVVYHPDRKNH